MTYTYEEAVAKIDFLYEGNKKMYEESADEASVFHPYRERLEQSHRMSVANRVRDVAVLVGEPVPKTELEIAAANVRYLKTIYDIEKAKRTELHNAIFEVEDRMCDLYAELDTAKQSLLETVLQTKGDK